MKVTICTNTETLESIWSDIFHAANWFDANDWHREIAQHWAKTFADALDAADIEWEYESSFEFWHGGRGSGTYHYQGNDDRVAAACASADAAARGIATADVAAMLESADAEN